MRATDVTLRFLRDYYAADSKQPMYLAGQVAAVNKIFAQCLVELGYAEYFVTAKGQTA